MVQLIQNKSEYDIKKLGPKYGFGKSTNEDINDMEFTFCNIFYNKMIAIIKNNCAADVELLWNNNYYIYNSARK